MKKIGMGTLLLIVFLIGCATAVVTQSLVVPPIRANTNPTRWEYNCFFDNAVDVENLNRHGAQGWEMAGTFTLPSVDIKICMKRPIP